MILLFVIYVSKRSEHQTTKKKGEIMTIPIENGKQFWKQN